MWNVLYYLSAGSSKQEALREQAGSYDPVEQAVPELWMDAKNAVLVSTWNNGNFSGILLHWGSFMMDPIRSGTYLPYLFHGSNQPYTWTGTPDHCSETETLLIALLLHKKTHIRKITVAMTSL